MKAITFDTTTLSNQTASSKFASLFYFTGVNHSTSTIKISKSTVNCGCTVVNIPEEILPGSTFTITLTINKINQKGYFSHSATIEFDNGQTFTLSVNGSIK